MATATSTPRTPDAAGESRRATGEARRPPATPRFSEHHAARFIRHVLDPSIGCSEVRLFGASFDNRSAAIVAGARYSRTLGGWYDRPDHLIADLKRISGVSAYITVNPVKPVMLARIDNNIGKLDRGQGTSDDNILCLRWAYIDIDRVKTPDAPDGISAAQDEIGEARARLDVILAACPEIASSAIWGCSGNGYWILVRLPDYPNDPEHNDLIARFLATLSARFSDDRAAIDVKTKNPSRVMCLPGTAKCKGSNREDRPWRLVTIESPEGHEPGVLELRGWLAENEIRPETNGHANGHVNGRANGHAAPLPPAGAAQARGRKGGPSRSSGAAIWRAMHYISKIDPAISGQGGHDQTFDVACALVKGFGLSIDEARPILEGWNKSCVPPWSSEELEHKLRDADEKPDDKPRGYMLDRPPKDGEGKDDPEADDEGDDPFGAIDDPHRLARVFLSKHRFHIDGPTIRFWKGDFYDWRAGSYRIQDIPELKAELSSFANEEFERIYARQYAAWLATGKDEKKKPKYRSVGTVLTNNIILAMSGLTLLNSKTFLGQPSWIGNSHAWSPLDILPTEDKLIHLPSSGVSADCAIPVTPLFFSLRTAGCPFDPDAPPPTNWIKFLDDLWGDDAESIGTLQEWMGYLLTPDTTQQKMVMLIGPKRSGKGTIVRIITAMLGPDNVTNPTLSSIADRFGLEPFIGKLAAILTDARLSNRADIAEIVEQLLAISGEDSRSVARKHKTALETKLATRFTIVSNELPRFKDASKALSSRMIFLRITRSFYGSEDTGLMSRLLPELPSILLWSVEGWKRLRERGYFAVPKSSQEIARAMDDISSPVAAFLRDCCKVGPKEWVPIQDLFLQWKNWNESKNRTFVGDDETFGRDLRAVVPELERRRPRVNGKQIWCYKGVRLLKSDEYNETPDDEDENVDRDDGFVPF